MKNDLYWMTPLAFILMMLLLFNNCTGQVSKKMPPAMEVMYEVTHTKDEWKNILSDDQYYILRRSGTERAFTSPFNNLKKEGIYLCAADSTHLFSSNDKFDSGTGWPSFSGANNLEYEWDGRATEVRCITCGGHLGHLFKDGEWTGSHNENRYCINGDALLFTDGETLTRGDQ